MFEKEIKFIGDFCLNQVKYLGSHFTFQKITATELHPAIVRYISAELEFMIYSDRRKLLQHSYFDYSGKEISDYFRKINFEIKKTKRIAFDDAKKLILQAVSFNANYVVRPNWSLSQLIYNDQDSISIDELEMMLNYIYYYEHLKKVLLAYLTKRNIVQISKNEFDLILKKIDQELVKSNAEQLIQNALASIGDFFNIGGVERDLVSPIAVEIFLKEKNLFGQLLKMRKGISDPAKKKYTIDSMIRVMYAEDVVEEKEEEPAVEADEENLGELADKHAENLDKAGAEELINLEEEEALLALYEEELKVTSSEEESDLEEGDGEESTIEEKKEEVADRVEESDLKASEKEIVDEMIKDYFNDEVSKDEVETSSEEAVSEEEMTPEEGVIEKKISSVEDELLDVFENLDVEETTMHVEETPLKEAEFDRKAEQESDPEEKTFEAGEKIEIEEESELSDEEPMFEAGETVSSAEEEIPVNETEHVEDESDEPTEEMPKIRKKDLFSYMSRKETRKILSHIFLKDEEDFTNTVEKIMECGSYKEASEILKSVFNSYKVSPYAKDAVNFTNAVSNYFRQA
jgi:hypothetical protein